MTEIRVGAVSRGRDVQRGEVGDEKDRNKGQQS